MFIILFVHVGIETNASMAPLEIEPNLIICKNTNTMNKFISTIHPPSFKYKNQNTIHINVNNNNCSLQLSTEDKIKFQITNTDHEISEAATLEIIPPKLIQIGTFSLAKIIPIPITLTILNCMNVAIERVNIYTYYI
jgi:hypothetical protein